MTESSSSYSSSRLPSNTVTGEPSASSTLAGRCELRFANAFPYMAPKSAFTSKFLTLYALHRGCSTWYSDVPPRRVGGDVSEREDVFITAHLQSWFNHEQATPVFINLELFYQRIHAHPRRPSDCGGFDFGLFMIVLESDALLSHAHNPCVSERLNARMKQSGLDKLANLIAHAWYQAVRHLDHQHARLATQREPDVSRVVTW